MIITYMWEPTSIVWLLCQKLHLPGKFMCQENLCIFGTCLRIDLLHTCMYVQEKKCEPLGTSYTTKSSILNKKNDHCVTIFRLEAFGAVVSPKLPHYLMKERDKGPESYTPVCHHLKQKCKFRDSCSLPYCMYIVKCYHNVQTTHLLISGI